MNNHIPYLSLAEVVDQYCASNFNNDRKYYDNYLVHGRWIYTTLFKQTLIEILHVYLEIDKSTVPHSVKIPRWAMRFINISVETEDGELCNMTEHGKMNTTPKPLAKAKCGCKCGCTEHYCALSAEFSVRTKEVVIDGTTYVEKIWNKRCGDGAVLEIRSVPTKDYKDPDHWNVIYLDQERLICNLDVKPCGCVKNTEHNAEHLGKLGCATQHMNGMEVAPSSGGKAGRYKIVDGRIYIKDYPANLTHALVHLQGNGQCPGEEIMVPEYAVECMTFGMHWRIAALSSGSGRLDVRERKKEFKAQELELDMYLNPVRMDEFLLVQGTVALWGSGGLEDMPADFCPPRTVSGGASIAEISSLLDDKLSKIKCASGATPTPPPVPVENYSAVHHQDVAATEWIIDVTVYGLNFIPNVWTVDDQGQEIFGNVSVIGTLKIKISFSVALTGYAYMS